jgi:hypothetical protein
MGFRTFGLALALSATALPISALGQTASGVALRDLLGKDVRSVWAQLAPGAVPPAPSFEARSAEGDYAWYSSIPPCRLEDEDASATGGARVGSVHLVFRDGRLTSLTELRLVTLIGPPIIFDGHGLSGKELVNASLRAETDIIKHPRKDVLVEEPGALPLEAGVEAAVQSLGPGSPPQTRLRRTCTAPQGPYRPAARKWSAHPGAVDAAGDLQGLALAPFAILLPGINAERRRAETEGPETMASVSLGEDLEGGAGGFARRHRGVRAYQGRTPDYFILAVNLGAPASRNLSRMNKAGFIGVRRGRVEWIAPNAASAFGYAIEIGLCLDRNGVPGSTRPGCTDFGFYSP